MPFYRQILKELDIMVLISTNGVYFSKAHKLTVLYKGERNRMGLLQRPSSSPWSLEQTLNEIVLFLQ